MRLFKSPRNMDRDIFLKTCTPENIYDEIKKAKEDMEAAFANFQNASDPDLIDSYIFAEKAASKRYRFLLKQAQLL